MRELFILRHAKAEPGHEGQPDIERTLAGRGRTDAPLIGAFMAQEKYIPDRIAVSPAKRTQETFMLVEPFLKGHGEVLREPRMYNADLDDLLEVIAEAPMSAKKLMLVGHNPGMAYLSVYLAEKKAPIENYPTCGLCVLRFGQPWDDLKKHTGEFISFTVPAMLR